MHWSLASTPVNKSLILKKKKKANLLYARFIIIYDIFIQYEYK